MIQLWIAYFSAPIKKLVKSCITIKKNITSSLNYKLLFPINKLYFYKLK